MRAAAHGARRRVLMLALVLAALGSASASACPVCYGQGDSQMTQGMSNGILTLLGVVGVVQVGFVALFGSIWYRTRRLRRRKDRFHLIEGGVR